MRIRRIIPALVLALLSLGLPFVTSSPAPSPAPITAPLSDTAPVPVAILGVFSGRLAIFSPASDIPDTVYDLYIAALPDSEQQKLQNGIPVYSDTELHSLLENYLS